MNFMEQTAIKPSAAPEKVYHLESIVISKFKNEIGQYLLSKSLKPGRATICAAGLTLYNMDFSDMSVSKMNAIINMVKHYLKEPFTRKQINAIKKEIQDVQEFCDCVAKQLNQEPMKTAWYLGEQYNNYDLQKMQSYLVQLVSRHGAKFDNFIKEFKNE